MPRVKLLMVFRYINVFPFLRFTRFDREKVADCRWYNVTIPPT